MTKHRFKRASQVLAAISGIMISGGAPYVAAQDNDTCTVRGKNGSVVIIVCAPGLDRQKWHKSAETACANVKACSAWIWDDPKKGSAIDTGDRDGYPQERRAYGCRRMGQRSKRANDDRASEEITLRDRQSQR